VRGCSLWEHRAFTIKLDLARTDAGNYLRGFYNSLVEKEDFIYNLL